MKQQAYDNYDIQQGERNAPPMMKAGLNQWDATKIPAGYVTPGIRSSFDTRVSEDLNASIATRSHTHTKGDVSLQVFIGLLSFTPTP